MVLNTTKTEGCTWYLSIIYATCKKYSDMICLNMFKCLGITCKTQHTHHIPFRTMYGCTSHSHQPWGRQNESDKFRVKCFCLGELGFLKSGKKNNLLGIIMGGKGSQQVSGKFIPSMWSGRLMFRCFSHRPCTTQVRQVMEF